MQARSVALPTLDIFWTIAGPHPLNLALRRTSIGFTIKINCIMKTISKALLLLSFAACLGGAADAQIIVRIRPRRPAAVVVRPPAPSPRHVWVEEDWVPDNRGGYRWHGGYWMERPRPRAVWVPGHWTERRRGWVWVPGHWR